MAHLMPRGPRVPRVRAMRPRGLHDAVALVRWRWLIWPLTVAGVIFLVGGCATFVVADRGLHPMGSDVVRDGRFQFAVTSFKKFSVTDGPLPRGEGFRVMLSVTNTGMEPYPFVLEYQRLVDGAGRGYPPHAMAVLGADGLPTTVEIPPRASTELVIRFDVPAGTQPTSIELHDSASSPGATVRI